LDVWFPFLRRGDPNLFYIWRVAFGVREADGIHSRAEFRIDDIGTKYFVFERVPKINTFCSVTIHGDIRVALHLPLCPVSLFL
jgi:hypothetical protein